MQVFEMQIKSIDVEKIRPLRHSELRQGQDFSTSSYLRDNDIDTFHMACMADSKVLTCATFYPEKSSNKKSKNSYRLRGMATDSNFRRKGYARDLMHEAFKELKKRSCDLLWCNARLVAVDFYKSLRFRIYGDIFYIEGIGPHYYMYKEI